MASNIAKKAFASAKAAKVKTDKITVTNNINLDDTTESIASLTQQVAGHKNITISVIDPTDELGQDGDIWVKIPDVPPVADYLFRFDASKLVLADLANVTAWEDVSTNNIDLAQASEESQPVFLATGFNGRPCVQFDGATWLEKTSLTLDAVTGASCFVVFQFEDLSSTQTITAIGTEGEVAGDANRYTIYKTSPNVLTARINYSGAAEIPAEQIDTTGMLISNIYDKTNNKIYKDGVLVDSGDYTSNIGSHDKLSVGRGLHTTSYSYLKAKVSEIIYFSRALSDEERTAMEVYLQEKWGLV